MTGSVPKIGILAWSFVGLVVATIIVVTALAAVSEIVLPLLFAAVLAVIFRPLVGKLRRQGFKPSLAAGLIVLGLLAIGTVTVVATAKGVIDQRDEIGASVDASIDTAADDSALDQDSLDDVRGAIEGAAPEITGGFLTKVVSGIDALFGVAAGLILGALIMHSLLKDHASLRRSTMRQIDPSVRGEVDGFVTEACRILREYGRGRTAMSAIVAVVVAVAALLLGLPLVFTIFVVNFIGGDIPDIGAFLGGGLAVIVALGDGGFDVAVVMLVVVVASNLLLENFVEPRVWAAPSTSTAGRARRHGAGRLPRRHRRPHPGVPFTVIAGKAIGLLRSKGFFKSVADRAQPAVQQILD